MKNKTIGLLPSLEKRKQLLEIIMVAAVLGFGVNLVSSSITSEQSLGWQVNCAGWCCVLLAISFLFYKTFGEREICESFDLILVYDNDKKEVRQIPLYAFSEDLSRATSALFLENPALKRIWEDNPLCSPPGGGQKTMFVKGNDGVGYWIVVKPENKIEPVFIESSKILVDGVEFVILQSLSAHLYEYFKGYKFYDSNLRTMSGKDIPDILIDNRFFKTLTADWVERQLFSHIKLPEVSSDQISHIAASNGAIFRKFDLTLPAGTNFSRPAAGCLRLDCDRFSLNIKIAFNGRNTLLPRGFANGYLGVDERSISVFRVVIDVSLSLKLISILKISHWDYFGWVDTFFEKLRNKYDFSSFLKDIEWVAASTSAALVLASGKGAIDNSGRNPATVSPITVQAASEVHGKVEIAVEEGSVAAFESVPPEAINNQVIDQVVQSEEGGGNG